VVDLKDKKDSQDIEGLVLVVAVAHNTNMDNRHSALSENKVVETDLLDMVELVLVLTVPVVVADHFCIELVVLVAEDDLVLHLMMDEPSWFVSLSSNRLFLFYEQKQNRSLWIEVSKELASNRCKTLKKGIKYSILNSCK
jgi:hypothetical protein